MSMSLVHLVIASARYSYRVSYPPLAPPALRRVYCRRRTRRGGSKAQDIITSRAGGGRNSSLACTTTSDGSRRMHPESSKRRSLLSSVSKLYIRYSHCRGRRPPHPRRGIMRTTLQPMEQKQPRQPHPSPPQCQCSRPTVQRMARRMARASIRSECDDQCERARLALLLSAPPDAAPLHHHSCLHYLFIAHAHAR
jgi:hypothetical protein